MENGALKVIRGYGILVDRIAVRGFFRAERRFCFGILGFFRFLHATLSSNHDGKSNMREHILASCKIIVSYIP
jgi:hypothetical protein